MKILKSTTQTLSTTFTDIGLPIAPSTFTTFAGSGDDLSKFGNLTLGFKIDFNDSKDFEVRAVPIDIVDGSEYELPLDTVKKDEVENRPLVQTRKGSVNANPLFGFPIGLTIDAVQVQVRVKTVGSTAGEITRAVYNVGYTQ